MINARALMAASLVAGQTVEDRVERISHTCSGYAGRELLLDEDIFSSQVKSGHRNRIALQDSEPRMWPIRAESVVREICEAGGDLELRRPMCAGSPTSPLAPAACCSTLRGFLKDQGCVAFLIDPDGLLSQAPSGNGDRAPWLFPTIASATVHFEDELLRRYGERAGGFARR
jgi:hypothetical protein